jgi:UDP-glucuronate decarboxylase
MHSRKRVLVTGGSGFIGSHLCERLLNEGHEVICLDNFFSSERFSIEHLLDNKRFDLIRHDIIEPINLEVDQIYNMACPASPVHYQYNPVKTIKTSVQGSINMLGMAKRVGARILQASTSEVYGNPRVHPQKEEYWGNVNTIGIRSCYDESKRGAEALTYAYMRQHNVSVHTVRIFNTYGPNMQVEDGRVVSNFIVQALRENNITVYGKGLQTRSFCYVDDLVRGLLKMMEVDYNLPINLGNPAEFKVIELAKMVLKLTKAKSKINFLPLPDDDPKKRKPDIAKARKLLKWEPEVTLEQGLAKTIEYFRVKLGIKE